MPGSSGSTPADAASHAGVLAVLTGRDYAADGHSAPAQYHIPADHLDPSRPALTDNELSPLPEPSPIAADRVRHVGEIVALAVAETREAALDALERIAVDYEPLPAAVDAKASPRRRTRPGSGAGTMSASARRRAMPPRPRRRSPRPIA